MLSEKATCKKNLIVQCANCHYYLKKHIYMPTHICINVKGKMFGKTLDTFLELKLGIRREFQFSLYTLPQKVAVVGLWVIFIFLFVPFLYFSEFPIMNLCCFCDQASFLPEKQWLSMWVWSRDSWVHIPALLLCSGCGPWVNDFTSLGHSSLICNRDNSSMCSMSCWEDKRDPLC